jgi:hypothetical protein
LTAGAAWRRPDVHAINLQDWLFFSTFQNTGAGAVGMPSMFLRVAAG